MGPDTKGVPPPPPFYGLEVEWGLGIEGEFEVTLALGLQLGAEVALEAGIRGGPWIVMGGMGVGISCWLGDEICVGRGPASAPACPKPKPGLSLSPLVFLLDSP